MNDLSAKSSTPFHDEALYRLIGIFGAPLAWLGQITLCQALAAYVCYPHELPLSKPQWPALRLIEIAATVLFMALSVAATVIAKRTYDRIKNAPKPDNNGHGRFLALIGALSSSMFLVAILFTGCVTIFVLPCRPW